MARNVLFHFMNKLQIRLRINKIFLNSKKLISSQKSIHLNKTKKPNNSKALNIFTCLIIFGLYIISDCKSISNSKDNLQINYCSSFITLKINKKGHQNIFNDGPCLFQPPLPDQIYINENKMDYISHSYYFNETKNIIKLVWINPIESLSCFFSECENIAEIDFSHFDGSLITDIHNIFTNCVSLVSLNFNNINLNLEKEINMSQSFFGCILLTSLNFSNFKSSKPNDMHQMFMGCISITFLDLSYFDTSKVTRMSAMLRNCKLLTSVDFSNFNTTKVTTMNNMFRGCSSLISLDINHFNTSSVTNIGRMFSDCYSLTSLNISNFDVSKITDIGALFMGSKKLEYINLEKWKFTNNLKIYSYFHEDTAKNLVICSYESKIIAKTTGCRIINCSINWREAQKKIYTKNKSCIDSCSLVDQYDYNSICGDDCPKGTYKNNNNYKCEKCHPDCSKCEEKPSLNNSNCKSCLFPNKYLNLGNCVDTCKRGYYHDKTDLSIKICKCDLIKCFSCSIESFNSDLCISCNDGYYPIYDQYNNNNNSFIDCFLSPKGYYLFNNSYYKKCYISCETCNISGNDTYHNCIKCNNNFKYAIEVNQLKNCYNICSNYYYFDNITNTTFCTHEEKCPKNYSKLIKEKRECISDCSYDNLYKYEFRNECFISCPSGSIYQENLSLFFNEEILNGIYLKNKYRCEVICPEDYPFEMVNTQQCIKKCKTNDIKLKNCIVKFIKIKTEEEQSKNNEINEITVEDMILENIEDDLTSGEFNTSDIDGGQDDIIEEKNLKVTLSTSKNQKNNTKNQNVTSIELGECENLLREYYKLDDEQILYIKKIDAIQEGMKIPKIEYNIYCKLFETNLIKLNLSICYKTKIDLFIPVIINETIDKLNSSSGYYNDICYTTTSESGTDITLTDRKNEFIQQNKTLCQENCDFTGYDYSSKKVKCSCKVKESETFFSDMKIDKEKLYNNFINIKNYANFNILVCYRKLFNKKGILYNYEFYTILPLIVFHIISIIIFFKNQLDIIIKQIDDIIFAINNSESIKGVNKKKRKIIKKKIKKLLTFKKKEKDIESIDENKNEEIKIEFDNKNENISKDNNPPIRKNSVKIRIHNYNNKGNEKMINVLEDNLNKHETNIIQENNNKTNQILNIVKNKNTIIEKVEEIMKFTDKELNELSYDLALKYDTRIYSQYTLSLFRTKHSFIFAFFYSNDYNSKIIKLDLFLLGFAIYYSVNALFFNDETMHKLYENNGKFEIIYQLPQIIYSAIISGVLNALLKLFGLSDDEIIKFKQNKNKNDLNDRKVHLINKIKAKVIIFFTVGFLMLLFFWYYLSMFGVIYVNTQIILIKNTLLSFALSMIYPFALYLIPGIFRIPALVNKKNKRKYLYDFSKLIQMI